MILLRRPDYIAHYLAARLFMGAVRTLPLSTGLRLGEWGGRRMILFTRGRFRHAVRSLRMAFPEMSQAEAEATARRVYAHFGRAAVEGLWATRMLGAETWRRHVVVRNEHYLREVIARGKGAIFVTAHLGVWEIFGLLLQHWGVKPVSVYRPAKNPLIDRLVRAERDRLGQELVPREGALPVLLRTLRSGGYIALLADQHAKGDGTWVPFFGRLASTTPGPALLAVRTGAPIVTGYACRLPGEYQFEAFCDEPIYAQPTKDRAAEIERLTVEIVRRTEAYIRLHPDQWLWLHRRWRKPPPHVLEKRSGHVGSSGSTD